ncbi:NTP transferase domain-containing protein [Paenibacillus allorhizosphaerae]|uniref:Purine catabolism protein PucB n=1 Tax=Paenibacillus allorhizosphaerae TaxID=2849866 RepID=A0ABN7TD78_9BACL|nr:nucleotidyltransferase family protein [Paenibacillus allorhizosphaerae]CAG7615866.1 Purine catabolism protein PucB [Paenibacillus allorhizosphaerae]
MKPNKITGIYLAAGRSTRMGSNKLRLPLGSMNVGSYGLAAAVRSILDHVLVVSGNETADWIHSDLYRDPVQRKWSVINCPDADMGQAHSLRCGVQAAISLESSAVMILLADQPLISAAMIDELLIHYQKERSANSGTAYAASRYNGLARPPVIFDRRIFPDLLHLQGDQGARSMIRNETAGTYVDFADTDLFTDVDTEDDYALLLEKTGFLKS